MDYTEYDDSGRMTIELKGGVTMVMWKDDPSSVSFEDEDGMGILLFDFQRNRAISEYYNDETHEYAYYVNAKQKKQHLIALTMSEILFHIVEGNKQ